MKTVVFGDGSIEATARADEFVAAGKARFATAQEEAAYERRFTRDDASFAGESNFAQLSVPTLNVIATSTSSEPSFDQIRRTQFTASVEARLTKAEASFDETDEDAYDSRIERRNAIRDLHRARKWGAAGHFNEALALLGTEGLDPAVFGFDPSSVLSPGYPQEVITPDLEDRRSRYLQKEAAEAKQEAANEIARLQRRAEDDRLLAAPDTPQEKKEQILEERDIADRIAEFNAESNPGIDARQSLLIGNIRGHESLSLKAISSSMSPDMVTLVCKESCYGEHWTEEGTVDGEYIELTALGEFQSVAAAVGYAYTVAPAIATISDSKPWVKTFRSHVFDTVTNMGVEWNWQDARQAIEIVGNLKGQEPAKEENKIMYRMIHPNHEYGSIRYRPSPGTEGSVYTVEVEAIGGVDGDPEKDVLVASVKSKGIECAVLLRHSPQEKTAWVEPFPQSQDDAPLFGALAKWVASCDNVQRIKTNFGNIHYRVFATEALKQGKQFFEPGLPEEQWAWLDAERERVAVPVSIIPSLNAPPPSDVQSREYPTVEQLGDGASRVLNFDELSGRLQQVTKAPQVDRGHLDERSV